MLLLPAAAAADTPPSCLAEIARAERQHGIPSRLLLSVGLAESGRRDAVSGQFAPWPWTVNAEGTGRFYDTREQAMAEAARLLTAKVGLVDVGCLQVDLYHHPHAFPTLRAAFDPAANTDYAARHLADLHRRLGTWEAAVTAYHAGGPSASGDYADRVMSYWTGKARHRGGVFIKVD